MAKTKNTTTKTQKVRARTTSGKITIDGRLYGGRFGKLSYVGLQAPDGTYDYIEGQRLYRLAKAIVRRFEAAE